MKDLFKGCWTVPNLISVIRIILIPFFAYYFMQGEFVIAVIILALSGLSDCVDGKIARRFNQISALGKLLDPLADKLTQITLAVILFLTFNKAEDQMLKAFSWVFLVFIAKEFIMVLGSLIMLSIGLRPGAAEIYGKVATLAFYVVMIFIIGFGPEVGAFRSLFTIPNPLMMILVVISAILTMVAFFSYIPDVIRQAKEKKANKAK
ncbi:MAG: CDP-alcohol phosphatidyltransferase family protein [Ruminococcaceae bacterium]|nr:CDP-alcohol phosphatidyltransferase family protein [Oscillospiraceae bacterium]